MKAVVLDDVRKFKVLEIDDIKSHSDRVIVDVSRTGICGSDIHYFESGDPKGLVMGHEFSGRVVDPGDRSDLKVGDRVTALPISPCGNCKTCLGGNGHYCSETWNQAVGLSIDNPGGLAPRISVRSDMVIKLPDEVSDDEGAMIEPVAVSLHAVHLANIKVGDKVLIVGGGIIGLVCAMFAKMEGASYVALTEVNNQRGKRSLELGVVDEWFDAKDTKMLDKIEKCTNGGFDLVLDCCGNSPAVSSALMAVRPGGEVVLVGVSLGTVTVPTVVAVMRELTIKGAIAYTKEEFETCINLIASKRIDVLKFIDDIVGLNEVQSAFERLTTNKDNVIKILVDPRK